jgi:ribonuclease P protein component
MLTKEYRIRDSKDFEKVFAQGERHYSGGALLFVCQNHQLFSRIGCVVGKKYSTLAVKRNYQKRIFLQIFAQYHPQIVPGYDIVLSYTNRGKMLPYKEACTVIVSLLQKAHLLIKK